MPLSSGQRLRFCAPASELTSGGWLEDFPVSQARRELDEALRHRALTADLPSGVAPQPNKLPGAQFPGEGCQSCPAAMRGISAGICAQQKTQSGSGAGHRAECLSEGEASGRPGCRIGECHSRPERSLSASTSVVSAEKCSGPEAGSPNAPQGASSHRNLRKHSKAFASQSHINQISKNNMR